MAFRVSMFWTQQSDLLSGWSENFWSTLTEVDGAIAAGTALRNALNAWHGTQTVCPYMRVSDVANFRAVQIVRFADFAPGLPGAPADSDYPTTAALLRLTSPGVYRTSQWLKGVQDRAVASGGRWNPPGPVVTSWNAVGGLLLSGSQGWAARHQDRSQPKKVISAISQAGVVTCTGHGLSTNDRTRISRAKGTFEVNQIWQVVVVDANSFSLIGFQAPAVPAFYLGNGTSQKQVAIFLGIQDAQIVRATKHNVGRPFGQSTGRRRSRAS